MPIAGAGCGTPLGRPRLQQLHMRCSKGRSLNPYSLPYVCKTHYYRPRNEGYVFTQVCLSMGGVSQHALGEGAVGRGCGLGDVRMGTGCRKGVDRGVRKEGVDGG